MQLLPLGFKYGFKSRYDCPSVFNSRNNPYITHHNAVTLKLASKRHRLAELASVNKPHKSPQPLVLQRQPLRLA